MKYSTLHKQELFSYLGIGKSRYYDWLKRRGLSNCHNGCYPREHWLLPQEKSAILDYCRDRIGEGYRRLTYQMLDADIAAVSPSTTYRILKEAGYLCRWNPGKSGKGKGFKQPEKVHEHWHIDICYVNILGTIYFLISILDGASRYIVHHELRSHMSAYDVEITIERAREKFPDARPRIISDNGSEFISKDFREYITYCGFTHVRTSVGYPQSNGKQERFFSTIKQEEIRKNSYIDIEDARWKISEYIDYYNSKRLHSAIYYLTPEDVLEGRMRERLKVRQEKLDQVRQDRIEQYKGIKAA